MRSVEEWIAEHRRLGGAGWTGWATSWTTTYGTKEDA